MRWANVDKADAVSVPDSGVCGLPLRPAANFYQARGLWRNVPAIRQESGYTGDDCDECPAVAECRRVWDERIIYRSSVAVTPCRQRIDLRVDTNWHNRLLELTYSEGATP